MYIPVDSKILKLVKRIMNLIKKEKIKIKFKEFKEDYNLGNFKFKKEVFELC